MAEIANIVFSYYEAAKAAASTGFLPDVDILPHVYSRVQVNKDARHTIRFSDIASSRPSLMANHAIRKHNAMMTIQIFSRVLAPMKNAQELTAREEVDTLTDEVIKKFFDDPSFADDTNSICANSLIVAQANDWALIGDVRHATSFILLRINPKDL